MNDYERRRAGLPEKGLSKEVKRALPMTAEDMYAIRGDLIGIMHDITNRLIQPQSVEIFHSGYCDNKGTKIQAHSTYERGQVSGGEIRFTVPDKEDTCYRYIPTTDEAYVGATWSKVTIKQGDMPLHEKLLTDEVVSDLAEYFNQSQHISPLTDAVYNSPTHVLQALDGVAVQFAYESETIETYTHSDKAMHSEGIPFSQRNMVLKKHTVKDHHSILFRIESDLLSPTEGVPLRDTRQSITFECIDEQEHCEDNTEIIGAATIEAKTENPLLSSEYLSKLLQYYGNFQQSSRFREVIVNAAKELSYYQVSEIALD